MLCMCMMSAASDTRKFMASRNTANGGKRKVRNKRRKRTSGRLKVSFKTLHENTRSPHTAPVPDRSRKDARKDPLADYAELPEYAPADPIFIKKKKSTRDAVEETLKEFKHNYVVHVLEEVNYDIDDDQQSRLEDLMLADPLGLKAIPKSNTFCWTVRRIGLPATTAPGSPSAVVTGSLSGTTTGVSPGTLIAGSGSSSSDDDSKSEDDEKAPAAAGLASSATATVTSVPKKSDKAKKQKKKKKKRKKDSSKKAAAKASAAKSSTPAALPAGTVVKSKVSVQKTMVKTPFYLTLQRLNEEYYKYIRASIFLFMDKEDHLNRR